MKPGDPGYEDWIRGRFLSAYISGIEDALSVAFYAYFDGSRSRSFEVLDRMFLDSMSAPHEVRLVDEMVTGDTEMKSRFWTFARDLEEVSEFRSYFAHWSMEYRAEGNMWWFSATATRRRNKWSVVPDAEVARWFRR